MGAVKMVSVQVPDYVAERLNKCATRIWDGDGKPSDNQVFMTLSVVKYVETPYVEKKTGLNKIKQRFCSVSETFGEPIGDCMYGLMLKPRKDSQKTESSTSF